MAGFVDDMKIRASALQRSLVLPEGTEPRTLQAAGILLDEKLLREIVLIGDPSAVEANAKAQNVRLSGMRILNPETSDEREGYVQKLFDLRKAKGMTEEKAGELMRNPLYYAAMMLREQAVDSMLAGAENSTADVLRAGFMLVGPAPGVKAVSSCFVMDFKGVPNPYNEAAGWGSNNLMIFSDCATIPQPGPLELSEIALQSGESCRRFLGVEPVIAMLSFSTKGSAEHPLVENVKEALALVREKDPALEIDGEFQADAALISEIGQRKAPGSSVSGRANVLVFPDLQSGNIGYKLVQRFSGADAYGPLLQGFARPISDLSRGCSVSDIVNTAVMVLCQTAGTN